MFLLRDEEKMNATGAHTVTEALYQTFVQHCSRS